MEYLSIILYAIGGYGFAHMIHNEQGEHDPTTLLLSLFWPVTVPWAILTGRIAPLNGDDE